MPEFNFQSHFLDTVGVEGESIFLSKELVNERINRALSPLFPNRRVINITRDASAEIITEMVRIGNTGYLGFSTHTRAARFLPGIGRNPMTLGYEFFTNPLLIPDMEKVLYSALFTLVGMGDSVSERAATHIHVGFAQNLRLMKRLLRICLAIDPVLFRLGGMGGIHRGWKNNCAYARPLMNSVAVKLGNRSTLRAGQVVPQLDERTGDIVRRTITQEEVDESNSEIPETPYVKIINPLRALEARSVDEFWASFGVSENNLTKYHPTRYTAINFYAILAHGTIEFRHPNSSLDPQLILALVKFIRAMVELSTICTKEEILSFDIMPSNDEISLGDGIEIITRIISLCKKYDIENLPTSSEIDILLFTLENSRFLSIPETPVFTHIQEFTLAPKLAKLGKLQGVENVLPPNHVDIHNIQNKESSLFDSFPEAL